MKSVVTVPSPRAVLYWLLALVTLVALLAYAATPPLLVPHGQPGRASTAWGAAALWQARGQPWFAIHSMADLVQGTGTLQRTAPHINRLNRPAPQWDAAQQLADTEPARRQIYTFDASSPIDASPTVAFTWPTLPAALRQLLDADGLGEARVDHLRGVRAREEGQAQGVFRRRAGVLGDIVRSIPLIVGAPAGGMSAAQRAFADENAGRDMAVYVGANDGMLHAFSAGTGQELFAYIPGALQPQLPILTDTSYRPRAWVDASASQRDVDLHGRWQTVLASGMGMGARGLFLLDITDPARFGQGAGALWEFTQYDDAAIGHLHAAPLLARLPAGEGDPAWPERTVAIVPSAINPLNGERAALFVLALDQRHGTPWQEGVTYFKISVAVTGTTLSPPAVVIGADGTTRHAYAGDLSGNLWHFDLLKKDSRRVFIARDAAGTAQPIAHAPHIVHGPGGGYLVIFGTGKMIEESDLLTSSFTVQSLYGIHDTPERAPRTVASRAALAERTLSGTGSYEITGEVLDYFLPNAKRGWYFDLIPGRDHGERAAESPVSSDGIVVFQTLLPGHPGMASIAGTPAGSVGRTYLVGALDGQAVDPLTGARRDARTGKLMAASVIQPLILITGAPEPGAPSPTGGITVARKVTLFGHDPGGSEPPLDIHVRRAAGRMGWREINNWQDLREAALRRGN